MGLVKKICYAHVIIHTQWESERVAYKNDTFNYPLHHPLQHTEQPTPHNTNYSSAPYSTALSMWEDSCSNVWQKSILKEGLLTVVHKLSYFIKFKGKNISTLMNQGTNNHYS